MHFERKSFMQKLGWEAAINVFSLYFLFFDHSAAVQGTRNEEQAELGLVCAGPWWREFVLKGGRLVAQELFRMKEFGYFSSH